MKHIEHTENKLDRWLPQEFLSIALEANQDLEKLRAGDSQRTYFRIRTMAEARRILSQATPEERAKRGETFLDGLEYRSRIPQGMHDRGEAYVFADHPLSETDRAGHNNHFPIYVRTLSIPEKVIAAGEVWDITLHPREWGADQLEEMYNIVNIGRLTIETNAAVIVRGNALIFTCQELIKKGALAKEFDIGILSTPHGFGIRAGTFDGVRGKRGKDGSRGTDGIAPTMVASILGTTIDRSFRKELLNGTEGANGENGTDGEMGLNGGACRFAEINIRSLQTIVPLTIGVISGNGGNGGDGGDGGNGGAGGDGVNAVKTMEGIIGPGIGGKGGNGGDGGHGGRAGHNGLSSNVYITVPEEAVHLIRSYSKAGQPGKPGIGGQAGRGGLAGQPGERFPHDNLTEYSTANSDGQAGKKGRDGKQGRHLPPAKIYIDSEGG